jgi:hypothetical protein
MTFLQYLRQNAPNVAKASEIESTFYTYLTREYKDAGTYLKTKDYDAVEGLRKTYVADINGLNDLQAKKARRLTFVDDLDKFAAGLAGKLYKRRMKAETERDGLEAMARAKSQVALPERINGDRVLHFTTAFGPIVQSNKLRISSTSDQGCLFCVPARHADVIADEPPGSVKQIFDIHGDLSHYLEFNLENSRSFESSNGRIDSKKVKDQKELKIYNEILNLDRRDPVWYEWKGKSQGGWKVVQGPYNWGKS